MSAAERIYDEVKRLPEELAIQVLGFVLFLEQQGGAQQPMAESDSSPRTLPVLDAKAPPSTGEGAQSWAEGVRDLLATPLPPKGDGLPMKRDEIYDRTGLR